MLVQVLTQHDLQELALLAVKSHLTRPAPGFIVFHRVYFVVSHPQQAAYFNAPHLSVV